MGCRVMSLIGVIGNNGEGARLDAQLFISIWRVEKRKDGGSGGMRRTGALEIRRPNNTGPVGVEWDLPVLPPWRTAELCSGLAQPLGLTGGSLQSPICH